MDRRPEDELNVQFESLKVNESDESSDSDSNKYVEFPERVILMILFFIAIHPKTSTSLVKTSTSPMRTGTSRTTTGTSLTTANRKAVRTKKTFRLTVADRIGVHFRIAATNRTQDLGCLRR